MSRATIYLIALAITLPWWPRTLLALLRDIRSAAGMEGVTPRAGGRFAEREGAFDAPLPIAARPRPLRVAAHVRARRRWQGGFGRRPV